ncbi:hypothetical protein ELQ35_15395 [Peribacillus cavernae]|uniref:Uncharacterized protein n=1 Tax=Peribacillus cavernae TaxID=1674310 RepID=A0A433HH97_9BACI|nr:hypothetical protein [Peribacillus cavernae]MDQ0220432.1 hypothetical protein [Peribacillus cavernae]RUQ27552.1 hypothetical protein ELQ35_15395 [Peribacillus cavernae]
MDELIDAYLFNSMEMSSVLDTENGSVILDADESLTGEPEIDWDDEEASEHLLPILQITSDDAYRVMERFAGTQSEEATEQLWGALNRRKFQFVANPVKSLV